MNPITSRKLRDSAPRWHSTYGSLILFGANATAMYFASFERALRELFEPIHRSVKAATHKSILWGWRNSFLRTRPPRSIRCFSFSGVFHFLRLAALYRIDPEAGNRRGRDFLEIESHHPIYRVFPFFSTDCWLFVYVIVTGLLYGILLLLTWNRKERALVRINH